MAAKFFIVLSLAVAASAIPLAPLTKVIYSEPDAPAHYEFAYSVRDDQTGDIKEQKETRNGDAVQGFYTLVQPDGVHRIVEYTSDKVNGFNANVRYEGQPIAQPAKIAYAAAPVTKIAYASAPVAKFSYAPAPVTKIAYASPVAKLAYAAPVAKVGYAAAPLTQFFIVLTLAVAASAIPLAPLTKVIYSEPEAPAHYEFAYSVRDDHTGDIKEQKEARNGDAVQGFYSLVQPDGVHRIVEYTSDKEHGFNANVRYEGQPIAQPAKIAYAAAPVAKIAYAPAPVTNIAYASPVPKLAYAAPVAKVAYAGAPLTQVTFSSPAISYHH